MSLSTEAHCFSLNHSANDCISLLRDKGLQFSCAILLEMNYSGFNKTLLTYQIIKSYLEMTKLIFI